MGQRLMDPVAPNLDSRCLQRPKIVSLFYVFICVHFREMVRSHDRNN